MKNITKGSIALATACAAVLPLSACGKEDPQVAAVHAFENLSQASARSVTLKLDTSPENLITLARQMDTDEKGELKKDTPEADKEKRLKLAQVAATTSITIEGKAHGGKPLKDGEASLKNTDAGIFVSMGSTPVFSLLAVDSKPYLKLDAKTIARATGQKEEEVEKIKGDSKIPWLDALADNKWITTDEKTAKEILTDTDEGKKIGKNELTKEQAQKLQEDSKKNLEENSSFTWKDGDDVEVRTDVKKAGERFLADYKKDAPGKLTAKDEREFKKAMDGLKSGSTFVSTWTVKDGEVKRMKVDVMQLARMVDESKMSERGREEVQRLSKFNVNFVAEISGEAKNLTKPSEAVEIGGDSL